MFNNCKSCGKHYEYNYGYEFGDYCSEECFNSFEIINPKHCKRCKRYFTPIANEKFCSDSCEKIVVKEGSTKKYKTSSYGRGRTAEYECMDLLRASNYYVIRSHKSLGVFDIHAIGEQDNKFIQVKLCKDLNYYYAKDIKQMACMKLPLSCKRELWVKVTSQGWRRYVVDEKGRIKQYE